MTTTIPQSSSRTPGLVAINALGPSGEYCTPNREIITDTAGVAVAECTIVPPLYVTRTIAAQRGCVRYRQRDARPHWPKPLKYLRTR